MHVLVDKAWNDKSGDSKDTAEQPPKLTGNEATETAAFIFCWCGQQTAHEPIERKAIGGGGLNICYECICNLYHPTNTHATWKEFN